jgi:tRNA(Ile)-lysidine synthase
VSDFDGAIAYSVIPVLVTGIQPPRVGAVIDLQISTESFAPEDSGALDSCDKHRNDGELGRCIMP